MSLKVLVADDSPTVQKVIEITLSNTDYQLIQVSSEEKLIECLEGEPFDLILLDFSLSGERDGHQLSRLIKGKMPSSKIIAMLTSFDSPENITPSEAGIDDTIIKPFDSEEFVEKCYKLTGQDLNATSDDEWVVDDPPATENVIEFNTNTKIELPKELQNRSGSEKVGQGDSDDVLDKELKGWGMEVPEIIDGQEESVVLPNQADLEYPDMASMADEKKNSPQLTSLSELTQEDNTTNEESKDFDASENDPHSREFENLIENDISTEDFWTTNIDLKNTLSQENAAEEEPDSYEEDPGSEIPVIESKADSAESFHKGISEGLNEDRIVEKLKMALEPLIEETIRAQIKESIEQVAWDVIPNLAENLIREEIQNLSSDARK